MPSFTDSPARPIRERNERPSAKIQRLSALKMGMILICGVTVCGDAAGQSFDCDVMTTLCDGGVLLTANPIPCNPSYAYGAAIAPDHTVWEWGVCTTTGSPGGFPHQIPGFGGAAAITRRYLTTHVLKQDGTVWGWGRNDWGQISLPATQANVTVPTQIPIQGTAVAIASGAAHGLALMADGTVQGWGAGAAAGPPPVPPPLGSPNAIRGPTTLPNLNQIVAIAAQSSVPRR